jgi:protein-S-isoprenylcysteine O-methyltransferase Ste14
MTHTTVFMTWMTLMLAYLAAGALLIPFKHRHAYQSCPKDRDYYVSNLLWWAVPLTWLLAPAVSTALERAAGTALFAAGAAMVIWARRVNPFFLPVIREPRWVVDDGPYRWLRHPGYAGLVLMAEGSFLMLGHLVGVVPLVACIGFLIARARRENRILIHAGNAEFYDQSGAEKPDSLQVVIPPGL